jgi:hypothetical protein
MKHLPLFDPPSPEPKPIKYMSRQILMRKAALAFLGNRCSNPGCRWLNEDGTFGCNDLEMLHIDHVKKDGAWERRNLGSLRIYRQVMEDKEGRYAILCANCNWKKRNVEKEHYPKPHTALSKARIAKGRTGWKHTPETKRMMSESAKKRGQLAWSKRREEV